MDVRQGPANAPGGSSGSIAGRTSGSADEGTAEARGSAEAGMLTSATGWLDGNGNGPGAGRPRTRTAATAATTRTLSAVTTKRRTRFIGVESSQLDHRMKR